MIEGGPCVICGIMQSSIWYGKKGDKNCKKAECMRAQGYLLPKKLKKNSAAAKRARAAETEDIKEEINLDTTITELIDVYRQRCALPTPCCVLPATTLCALPATCNLL